LSHTLLERLTKISDATSYVNILDNKY